VLEYLTKYFRIVLFYYNPNISPKEEFEKRTRELKRLVGEMPLNDKTEVIVGDYDVREFYDIAKGLEDLPEGSERCFRCYRLRLEKTAQLAKKLGADWFTTTLSISPYKNAQKLNEISSELAAVYGVNALPADFKKKGGYKRSIELSASTDFTGRITAAVCSPKPSVTKRKVNKVKKITPADNSQEFCVAR
jgi:predicted adenine nucleotide alpha hydrolase (AANH) superfamily ATPase